MFKDENLGSRGRKRLFDIMLVDYSLNAADNDVFSKYVLGSKRTCRKYSLRAAERCALEKKHHLVAE